MFFWDFALALDYIRKYGGGTMIYRIGGDGPYWTVYTAGYTWLSPEAALAATRTALAAGGLSDDEIAAEMEGWSQ